MAILNLQTGRQKAVQVLGLKELQQNINALSSAMVSQEAAAVSARGGRLVLQQLALNARASGVPQKAIDDLFMYTRQRPSILGSGDASVSVLVGLKKKGTRVPAHGYVTWRAGRQVGAFTKGPRLRKKGATLKIGGQTIGENLGTMWELGTTKMQARPWFRPAIMQVRPSVYDELKAGYLDILARHPQ